MQSAGQTSSPEKKNSHAARGKYLERAAEERTPHLICFQVSADVRFQDSIGGIIRLGGIDTPPIRRAAGHWRQILIFPLLRERGVCAHDDFLFEIKFV